MKLYHGSKRIIEHPLFKGSKEDNDYGPAFYLSKSLESAHEWACRNNSAGFVNSYSIQLDGLKILDLTNDDEKTILNHLAILLHYRYLDDSFQNAFSHRLKMLEKEFFINADDYDVIIGFRADDAYFRFPLDFVRGNLTIEQLRATYKYGELGVQYALISQKAIDRLEFIDSVESDNEFIDKYFLRVRKATLDYNNLNKDEDGRRIIDIIRELVK